MTFGALLVQHQVQSAAVVRRLLACDLAHHQLPPAVIDDAVLVASELVVNAVRHTSAAPTGLLDVSWDVDASGVRVSVADSSDDPPQARGGTGHDLGGRGLILIEAMSDDWGYVRGQHGKSVWAHVPANRHAGA